MSKTWDSDFIFHEKKQPVLVSREIASALRYALTKFKSEEFSIVCNAELDDEGWLCLPRTGFRFPKQEVSAGSIDYTEHIQENCVIHRHPNGMNSFSVTDSEFINQNFELSLLWTEKDGFVNGVCNIKRRDGVFMQVDVDIYLTAEPVVECDLSGVTTKQWQYTKETTVSRGWQAPAKESEIPFQEQNSTGKSGQLSSEDSKTLALVETGLKSDKFTSIDTAFSPPYMSNGKYFAYCFQDQEIYETQDIFQRKINTFAPTILSGTESFFWNKNLYQWAKGD